jgi:hypothetical protein
VTNIDSEVPLHGRADLSFAGRFLLAELGAPTLFAGLFVVLVGAEFFLHSAAFNQFLETAHRLGNWFLVVNPHTQTHSSSLSRRFIAAESQPGEQVANQE